MNQEFINIFLGQVSEKNEILGISLDVIVSSIFSATIAILIFLLGEWLKRKNEEKKEKKRLNELEKYFFTLVISSKESIENSINSLQKLSKSIKNQDRNFTINSLVTFHFELINLISKKDLYTNLVAHSMKGSVEEKTKNFDKIFGMLYATTRREKIHNENFKSFLDSYNRNQKILNDNINLIFRFFDVERLIFVNNQNQPDLFVTDMDKIIFDWKQFIEKEKSDTTKITNEKLIIPLEQLCKNFSRDPRTIELTKLIVNSSISINQIENTCDLYSSYFENESNKVEKEFKGFNKSLEFFGFDEN